ncbi:hypothetical protein BZG36_04041 [Bifiguratus adelaidae]|uniref:SKP1 component dimerisation domain-containing protein n=1 Tax=Bifiguratus adelaidae TaxID=1938954 RepID=A0A261Y0G2_9FUNG|nr:hypothetical protein BZG36_04041 [Bifiguratus adelaidae]
MDASPTTPRPKIYITTSENASLQIDYDLALHCSRLARKLKVLDKHDTLITNTPFQGETIQLALEFCSHMRQKQLSLEANAASFIKSARTMSLAQQQQNARMPTDISGKAAQAEPTGMTLDDASISSSPTDLTQQSASMLDATADMLRFQDAPAPVDESIRSTGGDYIFDDWEFSFAASEAEPRLVTELNAASHFLGINRLLDLTTMKIMMMSQEKTPQQVQNLFGFEGVRNGEDVVSALAQTMEELKW